VDLRVIDGEEERQDTQYVTHIEFKSNLAEKD
jgi:hypothetical protein